MEFKMALKLYDKIKLYNKRWSKYLIPYLESSETIDLPRDTSSRGLHIGLCGRCIVGEVYGFSIDYTNEDDGKCCIICDNFGERMCASYNNMSLRSLKSLLVHFYRHLERDHVDLVNKIVKKVI